MMGVTTRGGVYAYHAVSALQSIAAMIDAPVFGEPYVAYLDFPSPIDGPLLAEIGFGQRRRRHDRDRCPEQRVIMLAGDADSCSRARPSTRRHDGNQQRFRCSEQWRWQYVAYSARKNKGWTDHDVRSFGWMCDRPMQFDLSCSLGIEACRAKTPDDLTTAVAKAKEAKGPTFIEVLSPAVRPSIICPSPNARRSRACDAA